MVVGSELSGEGAGCDGGAEEAHRHGGGGEGDPTHPPSPVLDGYQSLRHLEDSNTVSFTSSVCVGDTCVWEIPVCVGDTCVCGRYLCVGDTCVWERAVCERELWVGEILCVGDSCV